MKNLFNLLFTSFNGRIIWKSFFKIIIIFSTSFIRRNFKYYSHILIYLYLIMFVYFSFFFKTTYTFYSFDKFFFYQIRPFFVFFSLKSIQYLSVVWHSPTKVKTSQKLKTLTHTFANRKWNLKNYVVTITFIFILTCYCFTTLMATETIHII